jgi:hypothetical protein
MGLRDKLLGAILVLVAAAVLTYYTTWVFVVDSIQSDSEYAFIKAFFLPKHPWSILVPAAILVAALSGLAMLLLGSGTKKKTS